MGRIRHIKPELFLDEDLATHKPIVRLLFIGLWTLADCEGRMEDRPARIKAQLFPYEPLDTDASLDALANTGHVIRYIVDGRRYLQVTNFLKHQRLSGKEAQADSVFPSPEAAGNRQGSDGEGSGSIGEAPDVQGREGRGGEGEGKDIADSLPRLNDPEAVSIATLPCLGKGPKEWPITAKMLESWKDAYPGVSPVAEVKKMRLWLESNPKNGKTFAGMGRFTNSWLSRAQNGAARATGSAPVRHTTAQNAAWLAQMEA